MQAYLGASRHIDVEDPQVAATARRLAQGAGSEAEVVRACFEFVRDAIEHSADFRRNPVTVSASEVLRHGTGFCYAKSHLLAALLRANGIPAGLCYQRMATGNEEAPYCLHGLNAVWLKEHGWYRLDPRGDKPGVNSRFDPPREALPFTPTGAGEGDLPGVLAEPLPVVVEALQACSTFEEVLAALPDSALAGAVSWRP
ncbi:transglutaminase family protein [Massilia sp. IC2-477]|uniref:transglutaminase-like domain-containing protein n=1 Tax=Massilia sp. IC2-477 TaxID=2887198 RepID=UPI001D11D57B|nr:transglutaminase family protein [Massilia sp. IC2-477]MCC2957844.1 transglutaminase family protein [Massilia sp. IC2-477]